jgi:hypothetical protein
MADQRDGRIQVSWDQVGEAVEEILDRERLTCSLEQRSVLAPAQHENDEHDYHDEDYRPDTDIHRLFLSRQRLVSIADVFLAPFSIRCSSATRT